MEELFKYYLENTSRPMMLYESAWYRLPGDRRIGVEGKRCVWVDCFFMDLLMSRIQNEVFDIIRSAYQGSTTETIVVGYPLNMNGTKDPGRK